MPFFQSRSSQSRGLGCGSQIYCIVSQTQSLGFSIGVLNFWIGLILWVRSRVLDSGNSEAIFQVVLVPNSGSGHADNNMMSRKSDVIK